jgi:predicted TIM-barrel fold metal-dependent hydrolase
MSVLTPRIDELVAIDVHTHVMTPSGLPADATAGSADAAVDALGGVFGVEQLPDLASMVAYYRERQMMFVAFTIDEITRTGQEAAVTSWQIAEAAKSYPDVMIPFGSVDPHRGRQGVELVDRLIEAGVRGFKFHGSLQQIFANDPLAYPLYERMEAAGLPVLFHTGQSGAGRGVRGGGGIRLKYTNPMHIDDVAVDFPDLPIIMAHPSFPWQDEAIAVALHKPQVYIDLSGWSPKYFPPQLVQHANSLLQDKVLFGSDFPLIRPDDWIAEFDKLGIKDSVRPKILRDNAVRLFKL